ncbi:MAG TPA: hypothetical protein VMV10_28440 [Pirellulales bacterium]|nr:hypothetical protein [Pirellulales bacterium]
MNLLFCTLILTAASGMATSDRGRDGQELYHCGFEQDADRDYDGWPDGWTRQRGPGFPHYVEVQQSQETSPEGRQCLRIDLDGGAAAAYSPPIAVDSRDDYLLEASLKVAGLTNDEAFFSVRFLDDKQTVLETFESAHYRSAGDWTEIRLGPLRCSHQGAKFAVIGVHLQPGEAADLTGQALFDDVRFAQIPRMTLEAAEGRLLHLAGDPIVLECRVSGCPTDRPVVRVEVDDALGQRQLETELPLEIVREPPSGANRKGESRPFYVAAATWRAPLERPGFYRIRATLSGASGLVHVRQLSLAVIAPAKRAEHGEFGWTLSNGEASLSLPALVQLAAQSGIHWLKFPLWYDHRDQHRVEQLTWLADRLNSQGIKLVGMLFDPPAETKRALNFSDMGLAADLFAQPPEVWYPSLEPVMARMSLKVERWQLGRDEDTSFSGLSNPVATLAHVKQQLDRIGQDAHLGVPWNWLDETPSVRRPPWSFLSRSTVPGLTADELAAYLTPNVSNAGATTPQWVSLEPLPVDEYDVETRTADLIRRMVAAKEYEAEKIFFSSALGPGGLANFDGAPTELLLPWRTTALALTGAEYVGSLNLPEGSENRVFTRRGQTVVVIWNNAPARELIFLGDDIRQIDAWGRELETEASEGGRRIRVGPLPTFIFGVNEALARWQMSVELDKSQLPSIFGAPHSLTLSFKNSFEHSANGQVRMLTVGGWRVDPDKFEIKLPTEAAMRQKLSITFPSTASCGRQTLRFAFDVMSDRRYQFNVDRQIELGAGDVFIKIFSHVNRQGELEVEQRLVNRTGDEVGFRCHLGIPNRRRMRTQVLRLAAGEDVQTYHVPDGAELVGQRLSIRAEEIGGRRRILNYAFLAEP